MNACVSAGFQGQNLSYFRQICYFWAIKQCFNCNNFCLEQNDDFGICSWILTGISLLIMVLTFPISIFFCLKVTNSYILFFLCILKYFRNCTKKWKMQDVVCCCFTHESLMLLYLNEFSPHY